MKHAGLYWSAILILLLVGVQLALRGKDSGNVSQMAAGAASPAIMAILAIWMIRVNLRDDHK